MDNIQPDRRKYCFDVECERRSGKDRRKLFRMNCEEVLWMLPFGWEERFGKEYIIEGRYA